MKVSRKIAEALWKLYYMTPRGIIVAVSVLMSVSIVSGVQAATGSTKQAVFALAVAWAIPFLIIEGREWFNNFNHEISHILTWCKAFRLSDSEIGQVYRSHKLPQPASNRLPARYGWGMGDRINGYDLPAGSHSVWFGFPED